MNHRPIPLPTNRHITARRDQKWPLAFALLGLFSLTLALTLALIGWPRLQSVSLHYDLIRLRTDVEKLQHQARDLETTMERLRAPAALALEAGRLGLAPPGPSAITADNGGPQ
ncbi:MAG: hypothetical protein DRJ61_07125 [Acidobacteria bacterium]|nr:MAG: hypothetical protein DRJ61_07125 [Acidobacteriota bacterium]